MLTVPLGIGYLSRAFKALIEIHAATEAWALRGEIAERILAMGRWRCFIPDAGWLQISDTP
jgi:hypothetical protein